MKNFNKKQTDAEILSDLPFGHLVEIDYDFKTRKERVHFTRYHPDLVLSRGFHTLLYSVNHFTTNGLEFHKPVIKTYDSYTMSPAVHHYFSELPLMTPIDAQYFLTYDYKNVKQKVTENQKVYLRHYEGVDYCIIWGGIMSGIYTFDDYGYLTQLEIADFFFIFRNLLIDNLLNYSLKTRNNHSKVRKIRYKLRVKERKRREHHKKVLEEIDLKVNQLKRDWKRHLWNIEHTAGLWNDGIETYKFEEGKYEHIVTHRRKDWEMLFHIMNIHPTDAAYLLDTTPNIDAAAAEVRTLRLFEQSGFEQGDTYAELAYDQYEAKIFSKTKTKWRRKNIKIQTAKLNKTYEVLQEQNLGSRKKHVKKNFKKKCKTQHTHIKQQAGIFDSCSSGIKESKSMITVLEKLFALFFVTYTDKPLYQALSAAVMLFQGSITTTAMDLVKDCINEWKDSDLSLSAFTEWCKSCCTNFEGFKKNKYATAFMGFLTKCASFIMCPSIANVWDSFKSAKIVTKIMEFFKDTESPIESIMKAVTYFVNAIDIFTRTGSMVGFLHTEMAGDEIMKEMNTIRCDWQLLKTGDLDFIKGYGAWRFMFGINKFHDTLLSYRRTRKGPEVRVVDVWLTEINKYITECQQIQARVAMRMQPFNFLLASGSGISKSHLIRVLCEVIAKANGIPSGADYTFYLNQANKFQSGWRNSNTIIIIDDAAAMLMGKDGLATTMDLADWFLRSANNCPHELLGADTSEKGVLFNRSLIQGIAANSWDLGIHKLARFPSAVNRRIPIRIAGRVRPEYTKEVTYEGGGYSSMIDYDKIPEDVRTDIAPDAWLFDVYNIEIQDNGLKIPTTFAKLGEEVDNKFRYVLANFNNKQLSNVSIFQLCDYLADVSIKHFEQQKRVLDMVDKVVDNNNYCCHGRPLACRQNNSCSECSKLATKIQTACISGFRRKQYLTMSKGFIKCQALFRGFNIRLKNKKLAISKISNTLRMYHAKRVIQHLRLKRSLGENINIRHNRKVVNVTKIQCLVRKHLAIKKMKYLQMVKMTSPEEMEKVAKHILTSIIQRFFRSRLQYKTFHRIRDSSIIIQSYFRRYRALKYMRMLRCACYKCFNAICAAKTIQKVVRNYTHRCLVHDRAVLKVQSCARMYLERKRKFLMGNAYGILQQTGTQDDYLMSDGLYHLMRREQHKQKIFAMHNIIDAMDGRFVADISKRMREVKNMISALGHLRNSIEVTLGSWFDEVMCDVIMHFIDKIFNKVSHFLRAPTAYIPTAMEGTIVGAYAYAKHPLLRLPLALDYIGYAFQFKLFNEILSDNECSIDCTTPISDYVFNKWIRTRSKKEKEAYARTKPISMADFVMSTTTKYTNIQKKLKEQEDPDYFRDVILPASITGLVVGKFIPNFCSTMSKWYFERQVGHEVKVEEIAELDKKSVDKWYQRSKEIFVPKPDVTATVPHGILENLVLKNTYYCRNEVTKEFCSAFSPINKYFILPKHFALNSIDKNVKFFRREVDSEEVPGNAIIEIFMFEERLTDLGGDLVMAYVEQAMDSSRTKDLRDYFPKERISSDTMAGSLIFKSKLGRSQKIDAKSIIYSDKCNNENLSLGDEPNSPFKGYFYLAENFGGLCGAVLVDETHKKSQILGFHVGGNTLTKQSVAQIVTLGDITKAVEVFEPHGIVKQVGVSLDSFGVQVPINEPYKRTPFYDTVNRLDGLELLGSIDKRISSRAKVVYTPICDDIIHKFKLKTKWGPPAFNFDGDKRHGVRSLIRQYSGKQIFKYPKLLRKASEDYTTALLTPLFQEPKTWVPELRILTDYEVVNGVAGKRYLGGMNMSSSFDPRMPGPKSKYAVQSDDGHWTFNEFVMTEYHKRLNDMKNGIVTNEIYLQCLKNEATPQHKIEKGKVRSFYMSGTVTQMIIRKYLLTTCRYYCMNTPYSETMVGINPHDISWDKFCKEFYAKGKDYMMALDFKSYDLTSLFEIVSESIKIVMAPLRKSMELGGVPPSEVKEVNNVLISITHLLLYSMVIVGGEVTVFQAIIPSGSNLTSILGSTIDSMNYRMAFYLIFEGIDKAFRDCITLRTYSDDSLANTTQAYRKFSARNVLQAWKTLGIPATGIEKTDTTTKEYYRQNELEFLKRKMIYSKDYGAYIAPLHPDSMFKCLCCHVPSKTVSIEALTGQCIDNFMFEARFHGKKFYKRAQTIIKGLIEKHDLSKFVNAIDITYEEHVKNWRHINLGEQITDSVKEGYFDKVRHFLGNLISPQPWLLTAQSFNSDIEIVLDHSHSKMVVVPDSAQLIVKQSGVEVTTQEEQVVNFVEADSPDVINIGGSLPPARVTDSQVSIQEFLSRPVKIETMTWTSSGLINNTFDPWLLLLRNPRISNKLATFCLFRATCKVKFIINGNGFYYGKLMPAYLPFSAIDNTTYGSPLLSDIAALTSATQRPHVFIDPTMSEGAEMSLPWFYHSEYMPLQIDNSVYSPGEISVFVLNTLKNVQNDLAVSGDVLTVTVYAWFENVEMEGATVVNPVGITAQSGREDETKNKPVTQFCTAVANASEYFSNVPVIGPYARAVEQGAKIGAVAASAFGYCKPVDASENTKIVPRTQNNMALVNTVDDSCKLSLDVKQELSIDPRLHGLTGIDEMSFQRIASIPTLISKFLWSKNAVVGDLLFNAQVNPYHHSIMPDNRIILSAMAGVAVNFDFWTGIIEFTFQVVSSTFHRGRLLVVYEPVGALAAIDVKPPEENTQYSWVVDIADTRDFKVCISNYKSTDWIQKDRPELLLPQVETSTPLLRQTSSNGVIRVYVLNVLAVSSPTTLVDTDIEINVYANAGKDFKVAAPDAFGIVMQSGMETPDAIGTNTEHVVSTPLNSISNYKTVKYMGEDIDSFRTMLKRFAYQGIATTGNPYEIDSFFLKMEGYPVNRTWVDPTFPGEFQTTLFQFVLSGFSGCRGSVRWKLLYHGLENVNFCYSRSIATDSFYVILNATYGAGNTITMVNTHLPNMFSWGGNVLTRDQNNVISLEIPFYSRFGFIPGKQYKLADQELDFNKNGMEFLVWYPKDPTPSGDTRYTTLGLTFFVAAGEDFSCFFFTGWPPIVSF